MSEPTHDDLDVDLIERLERLVRDARPVVATSERDRLLFEAGRASAMRERERSRWTPVWATAACLFAATTVGLWVTRPVIPDDVPAPGPIAREEDDIDRSEPQSIDSPAPALVGTSRRPHTPRAADRRLDEWQPVVASPDIDNPRSADARPLVPIRAWRDIDSL